MPRDTLESFLAEIFGCPIHGKPTEKSDSEASKEPTKVAFKLKDEAEKSKPQITLSLEKYHDGSIAINGNDGTMEKIILFFNPTGNIILCSAAQLDGLQTDEKGYVKIYNSNI